MNLREMVALVERDVGDAPHLTPDWTPTMTHDDNYLDSARVSGTGIYLWAHSTDAENLARVADTYQETLQEELWERGEDTAWPRCRFCPGTHPMQVTEHDGVVWWTCPRDATRGIRLGHLDAGAHEPTGAPYVPPSAPDPQAAQVNHIAAVDVEDSGSTYTSSITFTFQPEE